MFSQWIRQAVGRHAGNMQCSHVLDGERMWIIGGEEEEEVSDKRRE